MLVVTQEPGVHHIYILYFPAPILIVVLPLPLSDLRSKNMTGASVFGEPYAFGKARTSATMAVTIPLRSITLPDHANFVRDIDTINAKRIHYWMTMLHRRERWLAATLCTMLIATANTHAQPAAPATLHAYPSKTIRLILPVGAGSTSDTIGRLVARHMSERLGVQIVIDNQPGAGGNIGMPIAARAAPDGYTVLMISSAQAISPHLYAQPGYDLTRDFAPVTQIADGLYMLTVHPSVPVRSVKELIALARARRGDLMFGSAGMGTGSHLTGELFKAAAKVDLLHVPYRGMGPAIADLLGGQISMAFLGLPSGLPQMQAGKVRALAVTSLERSAAARSLPTLAESGLPGFEATTWQGFALPAATPRSILVRWHAESLHVLQLPEVRERYAALGVQAVGSTPAQFAAYIQAEIVKWGRAVRNTGIKPQ
jgi:tripartite-type tricarboxylate transporter receptor subunit TctC